MSWFKKKATPATLPAAAHQPPPIRQASHVDASVVAVPPASKGPAFNSNLIAGYHDDHSKLLALFGRAKQAAEAGQWQEVEATLAEFRSALTDHLLSERVRLYSFLKQRLADDSDGAELMQSFTSEMHAIGAAVMSFLDGQSDLSRSSAKQDAFLPAWTNMGRTLGDRIAREEKTLYPMYSDFA